MKQEFEIPEGCRKVTIEQIGNKVIATFEPEGRKRVEYEREYWSMNAYFEITNTTELNCRIDERLFDAGNYYLTPDDPELLARIEMNKNLIKT